MALAHSATPGHQRWRVAPHGHGAWTPTLPVLRLSPVGKLLLVLFTVVPLLEVVLLTYLGTLLGVWPTIALVLVTGAIGAWLAKQEGLRVWTRWQEALAAGRMPEEGILAGVLVLVGGVLLVTPGVLTDAVGLSLLVPWSRQRIAAAIRTQLERRFSMQGSVQQVVRQQVVQHGPLRVVTFSTGFAGGGAGPRTGGVIDVEGHEVPVEAEADRRLR